MQKPYFGRVITAMVTPFTAEGVAYDTAAAFAEWLLANGSDALLVEGSTGEPATMNLEEKLTLLQRICQRVAGKAPIIVGAGSNCTAATIEFVQQVSAYPIDGLLIVGPYYNKPTQEGYYQHFAAVARSTKLPIIIYNVPGRTGSNIAPATVARLAQDYPNIVAVKEAAGSVAQTAELFRLCPEDFTIYSGDDGLLLPFLAVGAEGIVSVLSNIGGGILQDLIAAYKEGRVAEAAQINKRMVPLANALFIESNPIPVKAAVTKVTPFDAGQPRLPLTPISAGAEAKLEAALQAAGLL